MRVTPRVGPVDATRRDGDTDHGHLWVGGVDRVVGLGQQRLVRGGRDVGPVRPELWHPEAVQVGLVADDDVRDRGVLAHERRGISGEVGLVLIGERRRDEACVVDRDVDLNPGQLCGAGQVGEDPLLVRRQSLEAGRPDLADADGADASQSQEVELGLRRRERVLLDDIVDVADRHRRPARVRRRSEGCNADQSEQSGALQVGSG